MKQVNGCSSTCLGPRMVSSSSAVPNNLNKTLLPLTFYTDASQTSINPRRTAEKHWIEYIWHLRFRELNMRFVRRRQKNIYEPAGKTFFMVLIITFAVSCFTVWSPVSHISKQLGSSRFFIGNKYETIPLDLTFSSMVSLSLSFSFSERRRDKELVETWMSHLSRPPVQLLQRSDTNRSEWQDSNVLRSHDHRKCLQLLWTGVNESERSENDFIQRKHSFLMVWDKFVYIKIIYKNRTWREQHLTGDVFFNTMRKLMNTSAK